MNWEETTTGLRRLLRFESQTELAEFVLKLARLSDGLNHHADMKIRYNQLELSIFTHDKQLVTELDWNLAQEIDKMLV